MITRIHVNENLYVQMYVDVHLASNIHSVWIRHAEP